MAIVGGGPAGCLVGKLLSIAGFSVLILEEHGEVGHPVRCAGLVSPRVLQISGVSRRVILNYITDAFVYSPGGTCIRIGNKLTRAVSIDRAKFDNYIMNQAISAGAECWLSRRVVAIHKRKVVVKTGEEIGFQYLVGADGPMSLVARTCGFPRPSEFVFGVTADIPYHHDPCTVDIFFGRNVAPGFFSWVIPCGNMIRVGLGVSKGYKPMDYFRFFLKKLGITGKPFFHMGLIPLGPARILHRDNIVLVGDAAGQVKPSSGGGLYPGLVSAHYCSKALIGALENRFSLSQYQKEWINHIGKEIKRGLLWRRFFLGMNDKKLEQLFQILSHQIILAVINEYGDIDYPSQTVLKVLKYYPQLLKFLPVIFL